MNTIIFGAGCFWGVEKYFTRVSGVIETSVGYMGGRMDQPDYQSVCTGLTGHAEVVRIVFDPARVSLTKLLHLFWCMHDPTTLNEQGPDVGSQYRSVIFASNENELNMAKLSRDRYQTLFDRPIVTEMLLADRYTYFKAEAYHQDYLQNNPHGYCSHHIKQLPVLDD